jgi:hypothetical protein
VRLAICPRNAPKWKGRIGQVYRVGYYDRNDGLDCIWLVNDAGEYQETLDHDYLFKYFDVIQTSDEKNMYGDKRPTIGPVVSAIKRHDVAG